MERADSDDRVEVDICVEMREAVLLKVWSGPTLEPVQGNKHKNWK